MNLVFKILYEVRLRSKNERIFGMIGLAMAQMRYQEMCRIVGDVVFAMVAEGHETKRVAIADVIRTELAKGLEKWDEDQLQCMEIAVKLLEE